MTPCRLSGNSGDIEWGSRLKKFPAKSTPPGTSCNERFQPANRDQSRPIEDWFSVCDNWRLRTRTAIWNQQSLNQRAENPALKMNGSA
ncbi:MAG TPA: hypothetical protein DCG12_22090 [Planctomycetaceae bacterium]|nr:hypothetical protein [Planctomycetaceae bacterium]